MSEDLKAGPDGTDPEDDDLTLSYSSAPGGGVRAPAGSPPLEVPPNTVFAPGQVLAGRFKVIRFVARGGMGEVYEAQDLELNERVAVKTARFENSRATSDIERFRREIQLARKVTHPNVCRTYDVFRHTSTDSAGTSTEVLIVSMELLKGKSLANRVRGAHRMTTAEALPIVTQLCAGLQAAHNAGVIHRDFKSSNVMLVTTAASAGSRSAAQGAQSSQSQRVVITDFGLAHTEEHHGQTLTRTGDIVGTPAYMSPEQIEGGLITPATDIYALGIVIYEMLTGELPFTGDTPLSAAIKRLKAPAPSPRLRIPDLDEKWETVVARCLEREPGERFRSTEEIVEVLRGGPIPSRGSNAGISDGSTVVASPTSGITPAAESAWRTTRWRWLVGGVAVIALAAAIVWIGARYRTAPATSTSPTGAAVAGTRKSVAILGFTNLSGQKAADSLSRFRRP